MNDESLEHWLHKPIRWDMSYEMKDESLDLKALTKWSYDMEDESLDLRALTQWSYDKRYEWWELRALTP
jgi:hypothetical protein